ncbi:MAG: hypothetical protein U0230_12590 [Polyangiales bacterium]
MSIALVSIAVLSLLMAFGALAAVLLTARGDVATDSALDARVGEARARNKSGDVHLFVRLPEARAASLLEALGPLVEQGRVAPERLGQAMDLVRAALPDATHAHAGYSHFHLVRVREDGAPGRTLYVAVRSRTPVATVADPGDRQALAAAFEALGALPPSAVVTAIVVPAELDRDPSSPVLAPVRGAAEPA